jgi:tetratricopeptide (TPR) repeat protein
MAAVAGCGLAQGTDLARELFEAGDWEGCRREAKRSALKNPLDSSARFLESVSSLRLGLQEEAAREALRELVTDLLREHQPDAAAAAALEWGGSLELSGQWRSALEAYGQALGAARSPDLALCAAAGIDRLRNRDPGWIQTVPGLRPTLEALRSSIPPEAKVGPVPVTRVDGEGFEPAQALVSLYRKQIRPAIGSRCDLYPSCSEYFMQAGRRHGWLAFPLIADRFFREPSVVLAAEKPIVEKGLTRIADPLTDHDFWFKGE